MRALLHIQGWEKEADIPLECAEQGYVYVAILPPFNCMVRQLDMVPALNPGETAVKLYYRGYKFNLPFFEY